MEAVQSEALSMEFQEVFAQEFQLGAAIILEVYNR